MTNKHFHCKELLEKLVIKVEKYPAFWDQSKTSYSMQDVKYNACARLLKCVGVQSVKNFFLIMYRIFGP